ncbi:MAG TPA: diguanylate cyclase [Burkholderiaceae bacterium]|jgi:diguanylate cyclase (GGDEF)-like protein
MHIKPILRFLLMCLLALVGVVAQGKPIRLDQLPSGPLGPQLLYLQESNGRALTLAEARDALAHGLFRADSRTVPAFGIGSNPIWVYVPLENRLDVPLTLRLSVGVTWLDHVNVYQVQHDEVLANWASGDEAGAVDGASAVVPGQGFAFPLRVPPETSEVFIRVDSIDPVVLPVRLEVPPEAARSDRKLNYSYGFVYGFLIALIAYNLMVFIGLRKFIYLLYAAYLSSFIVLNLSYTGHGYAFWWPDNAYLQRYASGAFIGLFSSAGLAFSAHFLDLKRQAPKLVRGMTVLAVSVLVALSTCMLADWHTPATWIAFIFGLSYVLSMVGLGVYAVRQGLRASYYFLAAMLCGMAGSGMTLLSAYGVLPMNTVTFHGVEVGVLLEATLLALALARDIRGYEEARNRAELLARMDALTGLLNRRAFFERATGLWNTAARRNRPLTVAMLDIDHFKSINDRYGHAVGDEVLKMVASVLTRTCRTSDVISRWGGEEFLLLLPETTLEQGTLLAERLRMAIERCDMEAAGRGLQARVSIGICDLRGQPNLEALIGDADQWLYRAKDAGRNQVMGPSLAPPLPTIMGLPEVPVERADQAP